MPKNARANSPKIIKNLRQYLRPFNVLLLLLYLVFVGTFYWQIKRIPPEIPLFYSLARGEEQLATSSELWRIFGIISLLFWINIIAAIYFSTRYQLLSRVFYIISAVIIVLFCVSIVQIALLIT